MTAWVIFSPSLASASALSFCRIIAEISGGLYSLPFSTTRTSPFDALATLYGTTFSAFWTSTSSYLRPMNRLTLKIVFSGFVIACRRATWPTRRSPVLGLTATTDGVSRLPSAFSSTVGSPASMIAVTELVVPRSMPNTFAIVVLLHLFKDRGHKSRVVSRESCTTRDPRLMTHDWLLRLHVTTPALRELRTRRAVELERGVEGIPRPVLRRSH